MSIFRVQKSSNYVVMNKTSLQDERLSWKAKGLHAYMLSMPNDWKFYDIELEKHAKDGKDSLKTAIKELKDIGYMKRVRKRNDKGKFDWETLVFEQPYTENPSMENPSMENPQLLNNDNTKYLIKEEEENPVTLFEKNFGIMTPLQMDSLWQWVEDFSNKEVICIAINEVALVNPKVPFKYLERVLTDWQRRKLFTVESILQEKQRHQEQSKKVIALKKSNTDIDWDAL